MDSMFKDAKSFNWQLCGASWLDARASKADMFEGSSGSMPPSCMRPPRPDTTTTASTRATTSTRAPLEYATRRQPGRRPIRERGLIVQAPVTTSIVAATIANKITCPKCGTFEKTGRHSCCAPGGAWFKNCGGAGNINAEHRWIEGVEACKRKFTRLRACRKIVTQMNRRLLYHFSDLTLCV